MSWKLQIQIEDQEMQIHHQPKKNQISQEHPGDIPQQKMEAMKALQPNPGVPGDIIAKNRPMETNRVNARAKTTSISLENHDERSPRRRVDRFDHQDPEALHLVQHKLQTQVLEFLKKNKRSEKNKQKEFNAFIKFFHFLLLAV